MPMKGRALLNTLSLGILSLSGLMAFGQTPLLQPKAIEIPATAAGKLLSGWLAAFNSGDKANFTKFAADHMEPTTDPQRRLQRAMGFRAQTGGFELEQVQSSSDKQIVGIVKE